MKNKYVRIVAIILPILLATICLMQMVKNNNQAMMPVPKEYVFSGEYSYDGENWYQYNKESEISVLEGDLIVKGHWDSDVGRESDEVIVGVITEGLKRFIV